MPETLFHRRHYSNKMWHEKNYHLTLWSQACLFHKICYKFYPDFESSITQHNRFLCQEGTFYKTCFLFAKNLSSTTKYILLNSLNIKCMKCNLNFFCTLPKKEVMTMYISWIQTRIIRRWEIAITFGCTIKKDFTSTQRVQIPTRFNIQSIIYPRQMFRYFKSSLRLRLNLILPFVNLYRNRYPL